MGKSPAKATPEHSEATSLKIIFLGNQRTGKTSLCTCYIEGSNKSKPTSTIGVGISFKWVSNASGNNYKLQCIDTGGGSRFFFTAQAFIPTSHAIAICIEAKNPNFTDIKHYADAIKAAFPRDTPPIALVVTKADLLTQDERQDIRRTLEALQITYAIPDAMTYFCSVLTASGVNEFFTDMIEHGSAYQLKHFVPTPQDSLQAMEDTENEPSREPPKTSRWQSVCGFFCCCRADPDSDSEESIDSLEEAEQPLLIN